MPDLIANSALSFQEILGGETLDLYFSTTLQQQDAGTYTVARDAYRPQLGVPHEHQETHYRWGGAALAQFAESAAAHASSTQFKNAQLDMVESEHPLMTEMKNAGGRDKVAQHARLHDALEQAASWSTLMVEGTLSEMRISTNTGETMLGITALQDGGITLTTADGKPFAFPAESAGLAIEGINRVVTEYIVVQARDAQSTEMHTSLRHAYDATRKGDQNDEMQAPALAVHAARTDTGFSIMSLHETPDQRAELRTQHYMTPDIAAFLPTRSILQGDTPAAETESVRRSTQEGPAEFQTSSLMMTSVARFMERSTAADQQGTTRRNYVEPNLYRHVVAFGGRNALAASAPVLEAVEGMVRGQGLEVSNTQYGSYSALKGAQGEIATLVFDRAGIDMNPSQLARTWSKDAIHLWATPNDPASVQALATGLTHMVQNVEKAPTALAERLNAYEQAETERRQGLGNHAAQERTLMELAPVLRSDIEAGRLKSPPMPLNISLAVWNKRAEEKSQAAPAPLPPRQDER